jgi:hypothetical protein
MELSTIKTALDLLGNASKGLESVRERAKTSNDAALKESISKLYDDFLDLKAIIVRLTEENAGLRQQISQGVEKPLKPEIRQVGETNYYFVSDKGPYCQPCYDLNGKLMTLTPQQNYAGGTGRKCHVCNNTFFETTARPGRTSIRPFMG